MAIQEESHPEKEGMRKTIIVVGDLNLVQTLTQEGPNQEREDTDTETQGLPQEKEDIMEEEEENRLQEDSIEVRNGVWWNLDWRRAFCGVREGGEREKKKREKEFLIRKLEQQLRGWFDYCLWRRKSLEI